MLSPTSEIREYGRDAARILDSYCAYPSKAPAAGVVLLVPRLRRVGHKEHVE
jgi:hypothetical protein